MSANRMHTESRIKDTNRISGNANNASIEELQVQSKKPMKSESPLIGMQGSEIRRSFKDVASYLTPNKSSSKSINQTS